MSSSPTRFYEFGPFRLDPALPLLLRDGDPVPIPPKALETLVALVERGGEVVRREELIEAVWPDTVVEENNLSVNVSMLRKTLSEADDGGKYIETVARRGYRFTASVRDVLVESGETIYTRHPRSHVVRIEKAERRPGEDPTAVLAGSLPAESTGLVNKHHRKTNRLALGLSVLLVVGGVAYFYFRGRAEPKEAASIPAMHSIAVLPLKAITTNEGDEALSLGLADSLITRLGSSQKIIVRPLSAITKYAGTEYDALEVGRKLQVDAILDGSFQRNESRLRVRARLLRVADGKQIWAGTFDEIESDIFKLQDAISLEAASALALNLNQPQRDLILKRYTENFEAYQAYLRGRVFYAKGNADKENYTRAFAEYEQALQLDPEYALAHAGLADAYSRKANVSRGDERKQLYEKAKAAALKSLALDENLAEANAALGWVNRIYEWKWEESEKHLKKAIELAPNEAQFRRNYIFILLTLGRTGEALEEAKKAVELDPAHSSIYAMTLTSNRRFDEAIAEYSEVIRMKYDQSAWRALAGLYLHQGRYAEALQIINQNSPEGAKSDTRTFLMTQFYFLTGEREKAFEMLRELQTKAKAEDGHDVRLAGLYALMGKREEALAALEKGFEVRDDRLMWIKTNSTLDPLRSEPRFQEILRKMNL